MAFAAQPVSPKVVDLAGDFEHRMLHTRATRLHAAVAGDPAAPLVLLLHGAFGAWVDYKDAIGPLADAGYHVAALDLRGYGMSDKPPFRGGDLLRIHVGDITGTIRTLGHTRAHLVGADTGGVIARAVAQEHPELVGTVLSMPLSTGWSARYARLHPGVLTRCEALSARAWRHNLRADTAPDFHSHPRFEEFLALRLQAMRIASAPPHISATSRLRPRRNTPTQIHVPGAGNLPHVERPEGFAGVVDKLLLAT